MIELTNIEKSFPVRGRVLDDLGFSAAEGSSTAITGPSGSGKTTLLNIIGALEKPDGGRVLFRGDDITNLEPDEAARFRNRNIGYIFQNHLLLPHLNIRENIMLPLLASRHRWGSDREIADYIGLLASETGIEGVMEKYPFHISGGEAQRAAFVRALANRPALLLADEPTGSLDRNNAVLLAELLLKLNSDYGTTLIVVTHTDYVGEMMGRQLELVNGKLTSPQ